MLRSRAAHFLCFSRLLKLRKISHFVEGKLLTNKNYLLYPSGLYQRKLLSIRRFLIQTFNSGSHDIYPDWRLVSTFLFNLQAELVCLYFEHFRMYFPCPESLDELWAYVRGMAHVGTWNMEQGGQMGAVQLKGNRFIDYC